MKTPEEAIDLLRSGEVEQISLDHDLGLTTAERERTGYDVLAWLEEAVATAEWNPVPEIRVHSDDRCGRTLNLGTRSAVIRRSVQVTERSNRSRVAMRYPGSKATRSVALEELHHGVRLPNRPPARIYPGITYCGCYCGLCGHRNRTGAECSRIRVGGSDWFIRTRLQSE